MSNTYRKHAKFSFEGLLTRLHSYLTMRPELHQQSIRLRDNQKLRLINRAGTTVHAVTGSLLISEENDVTARVIEPGTYYQLRDTGVVEVRPVSGEAALAIKPPQQ